ncbi:uncharacterized protein LOC131669420 [Phymastichus coffea]|uniref:uncharacterized protein LOC131669420 n=1 Tax=Phymastichus coffea TaxID=108790 RepID=UPI00273AE4DD|nr:uncharacterized protein LOC131669420 [Phymastichus coffea]
MIEAAVLVLVCIVFTSILFIICKIRGQQVKKNNNIMITKKRHLNGISDYQKLSSIDQFNYHKILHEFHNACSNCSNVFSSMKCIQFASNYPELINVKIFSDGVTPFHRVCFRGNVPVIEFMLAKGADIEIKTAVGENALCMALYYYLYSEEKDMICLNILYKNGCQFAYDDEWYDIFLNLAIKNNNKSLTEWLLTHSKSPKNKNNNTRASSVPICKYWKS